MLNKVLECAEIPRWENFGSDGLGVVRLSLWRSKPPHFFIQQFENPENVAAVQRLLNRDSHEVEMRKRITDYYFKFLQFIKKQMGDKDYLNFLSSNKREFIKVVDSLDGAISQNIFLEAAGISKKPP